MPRIARKNADSTRFYRDLGSALRLARLAAGRTQMEVADEIGVSFQQLQKYESGTNRIPIE
jgi:transcriptional regulator with XRE-family HTH domain